MKWLYFKGQTTEMRKQWVNDMTGKENVGAASRTQSHFSGLPAPCCPSSPHAYSGVPGAIMAGTTAPAELEGSPDDLGPYFSNVLHLS